jgi:RNA polymerase sigma-70 factor (ECF subfamily)
MHTTSATLLDQLRSSEPAHAWTRFVSLYTPLLAHWGARLGVPPGEMADFLQDVFLLLIQKLPEFRYDPARRFRGWLWTVTRNRWLERCRQATPAAQGDGGATLDLLGVPDTTEEVDAEEYRRFLTARALELMQAEFHPTTWRACWAVVVESRPAAEVATELGLTPNAVYIARSRVLSRLRENLAGLLD